MGASQSTTKESDQPAANEGQQEQVSPLSEQQRDEAVAGSEEGGPSQGEQVGASTTSSRAAVPPAAEIITSSSTTSNGDVFKVPFLPSASTPSAPPSTSALSPTSALRSLPTDIEHILSLGAHAPDEALKLAASNAGKEVAQVVREMKEKALQSGEVTMESSEEEGRRRDISEVEREMEQRGITRQGEVIEVENQGDEEMGEIKEEKKDVKMDEECVFPPPFPFPLSFADLSLPIALPIRSLTPNPMLPLTSTFPSPPVAIAVDAVAEPPKTTAPTTTRRTAEEAEDSL
jgi:hypothetical protein